MSIRRLTFATLFTLLTLSSLSLVMVGTAGAYATIAPSPTYSSAPGLPDGRVYELVSPPNKNGNDAGAGSLSIKSSQLDADHRYALAAPDGNSVLFEATGPMGETADAFTPYFVATHADGRWSTRGVMPDTQESPAEVGGPLLLAPTLIDPSTDLSHATFEGHHGTFALDMPGWEGCQHELYLSGSDPFTPATWLTRPAGYAGTCGGGGIAIGGTPDFSTLYFTSGEKLLPEDAGGSNLYEDSEGTLREAGVLPDGSLSPFGAVPAVSGVGLARAIYKGGNQVSGDGSRVFFVSPEPASCKQLFGGLNDCVTDPPELYVREDGERSVLVSRDTLSAEVGGEPASAPSGVSNMPNPTIQPAQGRSVEDGLYGSYVFASEDGSQAFFQSEDQLTSAAPANTSPKTYGFDVETGSLTYLPGVEGQILAVDSDGSSLTFERPEAGGSPAELDLWSAGPAGGIVTAITQLPPRIAANPQDDPWVTTGGPEPVRMSSDGSVVVFSSYDLPGFNDFGTEKIADELFAIPDIFRYDVVDNSLSCVSCAPVGVTPKGASMSHPREIEVTEPGYGEEAGMVEPRGISADGDRVFFETADPLVSQDANTETTVRTKTTDETKGENEPQGEDLYEWENGVVYLISTGKSVRDSYYLDSSENGNDVFFATTEGLVPGDTDGGYSVYDARVPRPGDSSPPAAVPCEGSVCQGPPRVGTPLAAPASATFAGLGNSVSEPAPAPVAKAKAKAKTAKCGKGYVKDKGKCVKDKTQKSKAKKSTHGKGSK
jgi:hypothetical protein